MCPNEYDIAIQTDGPQGHQSADPLGQKATKPCWTDDPGATGFKERSLACSWILPVQGLDFSKRPADDSSGTRGTVAALWLETSFHGRSGPRHLAVKTFVMTILCLGIVPLFWGSASLGAFVSLAWDLAYFRF